MSSDGFDALEAAAGTSPASIDEDAPDRATVDTRRIDAFVGRRVRGGDADVARVGVGLRHEDQRTELPAIVPDGIESGDFDETYPYPWAQWARSDWTKQVNFRGLGRVEDIDTGLGVRVEAGVLLEALGDDVDALRLDATLGRGWWTSPASVHLLNLGETRYLGGAGRDERSRTALRYQYFRRLGERDHLDLHLVADRQRGRSPALDLQLGGEYGLKGYPNAFRRGDTRLLGTAEYRHVFERSPFELVNLGAGAFVEAGKAWRGSDDDTDTLVDVGAGLLFSPSRGSRNEILRLDVTFPLTGGEGVDDFLLFVGTQLRFRTHRRARHGVRRGDDPEPSGDRAGPERAGGARARVRRDAGRRGGAGARELQAGVVRVAREPRPRGAADEHSPEKAAAQSNALDVLASAGVDVFWVDSNSSCKGVCARLPNANLMRDSKAPQDCGVEKIVNAHDNTIRYTDRFLADVIDRLAARGDDASVLYASDHGESLGENGIYLHGLPKAIAPEARRHVPMLAWFSDGFVRDFGDGAPPRGVRQDDRALSHDVLSSTPLGLHGVESTLRDPALGAARPGARRVRRGPGRRERPAGTASAPSAPDGPFAVGSRRRAHHGASGGAPSGACPIRCR